MARHSFIQMSKLSNVKGRISYISDPKRQEHLYATLSTREDMTFWNELAKECQEEFKRFGTEGKCIEAQELIIALPEEYTQFDPNGVYLPTKKIGKNNPKKAEIKADNAARQEWNRTADLALVSGIAESKIIEVKNEYVYNEISRSIQKNGWLPDLFRKIVNMAKKLLKGLIKEAEMPPKPVLSVDMAEYRTMQKLMVNVQNEAGAIRKLMHVELPKLEKQLSETTGLFKGKERKALSEKIAKTQREIDRRMEHLPGILKEYGYPDVQAFKRLMTTPQLLWCSTTAIWPHGSNRSAGRKSPSHSKNRLRKRASERNSVIWTRRPSAGMPSGGRNPDTAAMIMTEDAKTEENTAGSPCGAYINRCTG